LCINTITAQVGEYSEQYVATDKIDKLWKTVYNTVKQKFIQRYIFCCRFVTVVIYFCSVKTMKMIM
jgi:hypothetical protein